MSLAATAETLASPQFEFEHQLEVYARSTKSLQGLGRVAIMDTMDSPESEGAIAEAYRDFVSATEENLTTDQDYGENLKFNSVTSFQIVSGRVVDKANQPLDE